MRIPVVVISDKKLNFAVATLFVNLLETKSPKTFYELNALVTPDFSDSDIEKILSIEKKYPGQCSINVIKMDNRFDNINNRTKYIANACAYKMCLGEMFPQYKKVIYLDTDIIVFKDLSEMFEIELDDNYIGGVFSLSHYLYRTKLLYKLGIPNMYSYVNAGVLLLNLDLIRKDNIEPKLHSLIGTYDDSVDQHIYNKVCYGKIKKIPLKYNVTQSCENLYKTNLCGVYWTKLELDTAMQDPVVYHYTCSYKPWRYFNLRYAVRWNQYYAMTPFYNKNLKLQVYKYSVCKYKNVNFKIFEKLGIKCLNILNRLKSFRSIAYKI